MFHDIKLYKKLKMFLITVYLLAICPLRAATINTVPTADGAGIFSAVMENSHISLSIRFSRGARIDKLIDKKLNADIVYWNEKGQGGLFDDGITFSEAEYNASVIENAPERICIRSEAVNRYGVSLRKEFILEDNLPSLEVRYTVANASQKDFLFRIRNFGTPGGGIQTENMHYFFKQKNLLVSRPSVSGYQQDLSDGWFAIIDTKEKSGFAVWTDYTLTDKLYFSSGTREQSAFEWIYMVVPAGKEISTRIMFILVHDTATVGNVTAKGLINPETSKAPVKRAKPVFTDISGWQPIEKLYSLSADESARGFLAVAGGNWKRFLFYRDPDKKGFSEDEPRPRLRSIEVDIGRKERDMVPVELMGLLNTEITISLSGPGAALCKPYIEKEYQLMPGNKRSLSATDSARFWISVDSGDNEPGKYPFSLHLASGSGVPLEISGIITIWDVELPKERPIGMKPYAWVLYLSGENIDKPEVRQRLEAFLDDLAALRITVCDWSYASVNFLKRVKIAGTDETLEMAGKAGKISIDSLPALDFSFYDPWIEGSAGRGMTRFEINVNSKNGWAETAFIKGVLNKNVVSNSEEGWKVILWLYSELADYARSRGMLETWAKVDDEISPEHIPAWTEGAKRYRSIGYKIYTTNSINIPRNADWLRQMNEASDGWQVAYVYTLDFLNLTRRGWCYSERSEPLDTKWIRHTAGGAQDTWRTENQFFSGEHQANKVEDIIVLINAEPLRRKGMALGNKEHGVSIEWGGYLYVSLPDGGDPKNAKMEVKYKLRLPGEGKPPVEIEADDDFWFYRGGNYRRTYEGDRRMAWMACELKAGGYGYWTYWWSTPDSRLVWYDEEKRCIIHSPAWEGLRDGNEDAAYYQLLRRKLEAAEDNESLSQLKALTGRDENAPLRIAEIKNDIYVYDDMVGVTGFHKFNMAKRKILEMLSKLNSKN